jgi:hypothetical protein
MKLLVPILKGLCPEVDLDLQMRFENERVYTGARAGTIKEDSSRKICVVSGSKQCFEGKRGERVFQLVQAIDRLSGAPSVASGKK